MRLVWLGAVLMALGGLLSTFDRRYRRARAPVTEAASAASALAGGKAT
jgi:cytochrome c biogenesis factor